MDKKNFLNRIALDDLLNRLGLEKTSEEFKQKFSNDIIDKFNQLTILKLQELLPKKDFELLLDSNQETQDIIMEQNNIDLVEVMEFTADFLRDHLEDYSLGINEFLSENKK